MQWASSHPHQADTTDLNSTLSEHETQACLLSFFFLNFLCTPMVKNLLKPIYGNTKEQNYLCPVTLRCGSTEINAN